jgi:hypothetical protein
MQYAQVLNAIANVNGASFVTISTVTTPRLSGGKSNPHQGRVHKVMTGANVMVFQNKNSNGYENMVNRRLIAEGKDPSSFTLGPRAWGTRLENLPIVEHTKNGVTKHYLEVIFLQSGKAHYLIDGNLVPSSRIQGLQDATEGEQGGLSDKVVIRTFDIENITEIRADGQVFN